MGCGCIAPVGNKGVFASLISRIFLMRLLVIVSSHSSPPSCSTYFTGKCSLSCSLHKIPTTFSRPFVWSSKCSVISCRPISLLHPYTLCPQPSNMHIHESRGPLDSYVGKGVDTSAGRIGCVDLEAGCVVPGR